MAIVPGGIVSTQDLSVLFQDVNTAWSQLSFKQNTIAEKISYFNENATGKQVVYPFSPVGGKEEDVLEGQKRKFADALIYQCTVDHSIIAPSDERIYETTMSYDKYQLLKGKLQAIMSRARKVWDRRLAEKGILANPVGFDGVSLFNTAHPIAPNDASLGTYTNDLTATVPNSTGVAAALNALRQIKWMDGQLLNADDSKIVIVVPTVQLEIQARQTVFGSMIPGKLVAGDTGSAGVSNPFAGMDGIVQDVICMPELFNTSILANADQYWYMFNVSSPERALITSVVRQPLFHYAGLDPNEAIRVNEFALTYGWDAMGGVGVGLPQLAVRCKIV